MLVFGLILPMLYSVACFVAWSHARRAALSIGQHAALGIAAANSVLLVPGVPLIIRVYLSPVTLGLAIAAARKAYAASDRERSDRDRQESLDSAGMAFTGAAIAELLVLLIGGVALWASSGSPL